MLPIAAEPLISLQDVENFEKVPVKQRFPWQNSYELIVQSAQKYGADTALQALISGLPDEEPQSISFIELAGRVQQTANLLASLGVAADDAVSILLPSLLQTHFALWGSQAAGIANPINPLLEPQHIVEIMRAAKSRVLITLAPAANTDAWQKVAAIVDQVPSVTAVLTVCVPGLADGEIPAALTFGAGARRVPVLDFDTALGQQPAQKLTSGRRIGGDDIAAYFHTGGTTGRPKVARLTHANIAFISQLYDCVTAGKGRYTTLCALPLFHIFGVVAAGIATLTAGRTSVIMTPSGFRNPNVVRHWWRHVARFQAKAFGAVPTILAALLEVPPEDADISCLEDVGSGAAPLPVGLQRAFEQKFGVRVTSGYGMTESCCLISRAHPECQLPAGAVGTRLPYTQIRVAQVEGNRARRKCAASEVGTVLIRGPHVFAGYLDERDNAGIWVDHHWFNTGDMGFIDEQGFLTLTGRSKDLIIRGGHNIDPALIEEPLLRHPAIATAVAVGQPDPYAGEIPVAYVTLKAGASTDSEALLAHCKAHISERAAVPKRIEVLDTLPVTAVGKIFKPALRNRATEFALSQCLLEAQIEARVVAAHEAQRGQVARITLVDASRREAVQSLLASFAIAIDFEQ